VIDQQYAITKKGNRDQDEADFISME